MGVGCVFWIPVSLILGRRPVFLCCTALYTLGVIWAGVAGGFHSLLGAVCLLGFCAAPAVSTAILVVIDLTFIHERPRAIAVWFSVGGAVSLLLLSLSPLIIQLDVQWRQFYHIWIIPSTASFFLTFLFLPETYFVRPPVAYDGHVVFQGAAEKIHIYEEWQHFPPALLVPEIPRQKAWIVSPKFTMPTGCSWRQGLACYLQMLKCTINPLIFWVLLMNTVNFGGMMSIGATYPMLLSNPPYNLPPYGVSLVSLATAVGSLLAWPASSIMIQRTTTRLAARNNGVRHAEYILPGFILPVLAGAASVFIYAVVAEYHHHFLWVYLAYGLNAFSFSSMSTANTLWVTEAFPYWAAASLAAVGGVSYIASFGISSALVDWLALQGYFWVNIEIGVALVLLGFVGVPIASWGKSIRQYIH
ncbi:uncharacterized protein PG998_014405, partial [Apiospora kogelbergensis]|uniref:uncharacterized protein n=1 Tax=Apiospora kogelbergensis TaxID=1337665 RepID=UPI0031311B49